MQSTLGVGSIFCFSIKVSYARNTIQPRLREKRVLLHDLGEDEQRCIFEQLVLEGAEVLRW